jgi:hypothetical protein
LTFPPANSGNCRDAVSGEGGAHSQDGGPGEAQLLRDLIGKTLVGQQNQSAPERYS